MRFVLIGLCFVFSALLYFAWPKQLPQQQPKSESPSTRVAAGYFSIHIPQIKLRLYEGLPHQELYAADLESERKTKSTVLMHGYYFYSQPIDLKPEDEAWLRNWTASDVFDHGEFYANGCIIGFHPDFALIWKDKNGEDVYLGLCFRCAEMQYSGKDLFPNAAIRNLEELKKRLNAYHVNWKGK